MGYIHLITGNGKGKTTSAVGLTIRVLGYKRRVAFIQFDKGFDGTNEHYNERHILRRLEGIDLHPFGCERMTPGGRFRFENNADDLEQARLALECARRVVDSGEYFLIVLDEILSARATKLVSADDILDLMARFRARNLPECDLVMTGRGATAPMIAAADLVSDIQPVKHYFDAGVPAREGIEY